MFLLDTCTLIWFATDSAELSLKARKAILANPNELFVSAATAWEIAVKVRNGKLKFGMKPEVWYREALEYFGIREITIDSGLAFQASKLANIHNDPFDRMIIATSQTHKMSLITCDKIIMQYHGINILW